MPRCQALIDDGSRCLAPNACAYDHQRECWVCQDHAPACDFCGVQPAIWNGLHGYRCPEHLDLTYEPDLDIDAGRGNAGEPRVEHL